ncbi:hypothetical protein ACVWZK_009204 [Bradyrhizobium sp. GM0.4]
MLDRKQGHQEQIDDDGLGHGRVGPGIDGLRHHQPHDETDGVENGDEKHEIRRNSVQKGDELENA